MLCHFSWRDGNEYLLTSGREVDRQKKCSHQSPAWWSHEVTGVAYRSVRDSKAATLRKKPTPAWGTAHGSWDPGASCTTWRLLYRSRGLSPARFTLHIIFGRSLWILYILGIFFIDLWVVDFLSLVSFVYFLRLNDPPSRMECFNSEELSIQPCVKTLHIIFRCHTWRWLGGGKRETVILLSEFSLAQSKPVTQHLKDPFTWKLDRVFCFQIHFTWISNETYFV